MAGQPFEEVIFTGGSARVPFWAQMMADVSGRALLVPQVLEIAAAAGAQLVRWGQGDKKTAAPPLMTRYEPDPVQTAAYEPVYRAYLEVFEKMQRHFAV